ncbi:uncharacterized protein H6S33_008186 [Morchella sextelata]|uniref:uncharacterized protein n=1 Tax=Morchella sextelata TaxID=1174677 RepID=UPI001D039947|nr:uncharacterized protein H6S33_008186 [Morchella sextelata]KAH0603182.1 hypothetical protein H6S33_008186 [Morchella sextelata]
MEYVENGDLAMYLAQKDESARQDASEISIQLLESLEFLHKMGVFHRDLKLQNVLVACKSLIRVKLADFGLAKSIDGTQLRSIVGTPNYQAPELFNLLPPTLRTSKQSKFTTAVDMWSLGCLVHKILALETPFLTEEDETVPSGFVINSGELEKCIDTHILSEFCCGRIDFPKNRLKASKAPESAIDFIQRLLVPDPNRRMTASEALQHRWLSEDCLKRGRIAAITGPESTKKIAGASLVGYILAKRGLSQTDKGLARTTLQGS